MGAEPFYELLWALKEASPIGGAQRACSSLIGDLRVPDLRGTGHHLLTAVFFFLSVPQASVSVTIWKDPDMTILFHLVPSHPIHLSALTSGEGDSVSGPLPVPGA